MSAAPSPFAQLYYTWDELDVLARLVDSEIILATGVEFVMLNSLRTSLREAQYSLRVER